MILALGYPGVLRYGVVPLDWNIIAGILGDDISFFVDNSDVTSISSSIKIAECNDAVFMDVADLSTVH